MKPPQPKIKLELLYEVRENLSIRQIRAQITSNDVEKRDKKKKA